MTDLEQIQVAMQTRQVGLEGTGEIKLRHLVKETLRMRPSRIVSAAPASLAAWAEATATERPRVSRAPPPYRLIDQATPMIRRERRQSP